MRTIREFWSRFRVWISGEHVHCLEHKTMDGGRVSYRQCAKCGAVQDLKKEEQ